jgi:hypothetical protein
MMVLLLCFGYEIHCLFDLILEIYQHQHKRLLTVWLFNRMFIPNAYRKNSSLIRTVTE